MTRTTRIITIILFVILHFSCEHANASEYKQLTSLPTVYIETEGQQTINSKENYLTCRLIMVNGKEQRVFDNVQIRGRGNSTWYKSEKKPYRLKFPIPCRLLGERYANARVWTLLANHGDKTLIRNALTHDLGRFVGLPFCPASVFIDLYVNGEYVGNYQVSDQIQANSKRVPINKKNGWLLETSGKWNMERNHFTTTGGMTYNVMNPKTKNLNETKLNYIRLWMEKMESAIFSEHFTDTICGYRAYIDCESLIKWYVASEITGNLDALLSVYMHKEDGDGRIKFGPMWDMDFAYDRSGEYSLEKDMEAFADFHDRPFQRVIQRLWQDPWFAKACHDKLETLVSDGLVTYLDEHIDSLSKVIKHSRKQNFRRWSISEPVYPWERSHYHKSYRPYINDLRHFLRIHIPYLRQRFKELSETRKQIDNCEVKQSKHETSVS